MLLDLLIHDPPWSHLSFVTSWFFNAAPLIIHEMLNVRGYIYSLQVTLLQEREELVFETLEIVILEIGVWLCASIKSRGGA